MRVAGQLEQVRVFFERMGRAVLRRSKRRHVLGEYVGIIEKLVDLEGLDVGKVDVHPALHVHAFVGQIEGMRVPHDDALQRQQRVSAGGILDHAHRFLSQHQLRRDVAEESPIRRTEGIAE